MTNKIRLTELKKGQKAVIAELAAFDDMRRRLQDIGLIDGTEVECLGKSPLGDPAAYLIRGAVIALRSEDSGRIFVWLREERKEEAQASEDEAVFAADTNSQEGRIWG